MRVCNVQCMAIADNNGVSKLQAILGEDFLQSCGCINVCKIITQNVLYPGSHMYHRKHSVFDIKYRAAALGFAGWQQQDTDRGVCNQCQPKKSLEKSLNTPKCAKRPPPPLPSPPHDMKSRPKQIFILCVLAGFVGWQQQDIDGGVRHNC